MEPNTCQLQNEFLNATKVFRFISKLDIFPLISAADKVWSTELILIHKNIRSVRNFHWSIWPKTHYDVTVKSNNVSSEGLDKHYH